MTVAALIVAAGRGSRAGEGIPKQYRQLQGKPVLARTLWALLSHSGISRTVVVIHPDDRDFYEEAIRTLPSPSWSILPCVHGGETRQDSVRNGLEALATLNPEIVLVHDAARPFVGPDLIDRAVEAAERWSAAVPGTPVTDTIKVIGDQSEVLSTPDRSRLRAVQTPQAFRFPQLLDAHRKAAASDLHSFTDDGALAEWAGLPVHVFEGESDNIKLTHPVDFQEAERRLKGEEMTCVTRLGTGFDVHAFSEGDHVWLGGIKVPHDRGVIAHSDGDVILHALTDALLGALADGDIGTHFPPSDQQWRGASSDRFLAHAVELVRKRGGIVDHLDSTLLCEMPRLGPHREAMRQRIAEIAGLRLDQVSLKATTTEKLGFTGRREGIAAQAAATIRLPEVSA
ncbi:bifunctional 2-C-methyl-D-erythritol 4-phosphate cytidylyltransferase/2-C-methyl-D-erythritol 2,4-cyclodiphosphate synthase [Microvirga sp. 3-52]|uniref:bifunctional 2-C-methyl-D-erythritol 4-phosphate cytidylyltransferase/2-C-methyl-D-erythritol 2,4-cyclodiphosphate synthase n=1 Tax=Microvirga sp. 3-52 TaxID=2792425 RepID=UPI001AD0FAF0|nr:bifunctional 2-C-methyl-D-erythritol 4-phosphate cytidylyltransferase/2-C-methyl-D-erythritol 2,4-cyclodiphosphate synthase [Microvirga sp. 3-52]MBO1908235.1 bifunctional 2-C-methyl-D-erythritol 4-phosphate cytidylyltransferase/2-C-methyl-D-erythritol 2,4-cyclodiphosphate synthase [Microvirga sp. 3-52]MBS7455317.1 bifunctional 2-C-methyl-D-erythritol 4-phosphate cytidylyltransferase/2-C-methyl-D-erythritol 2,4-cyclodiphosphate synthase [Microvirga sp. 3-52]